MRRTETLTGDPGRVIARRHARPRASTGPPARLLYLAVLFAAMAVDAVVD